MRKMNMMKKTMAVIMTAAMTAAMAGCAGQTAATADTQTESAGDGAEGKESEAPAAGTETGAAAAGETESGESSQGELAQRDITVGVIQMIDNGAFSDMRDGFVEEITGKYTGGEVEILDRNAQGDAAALNTICQEMADSRLNSSSCPSVSKRIRIPRATTSPCMCSSSTCFREVSA